MARRVRFEVEGGWYHVTGRGVERRAIFRDGGDREGFVGRVGEMSGRFGVEVAAYVLMGDHYHLLVRTPEGNLSRAIQWLGRGKVARRRFAAGVGQASGEMRFRVSRGIVELVSGVGQAGGLPGVRLHGDD